MRIDIRYQISDIGYLNSGEGAAGGGLLNFHRAQRIFPTRHNPLLHLLRVLSHRPLRSGIRPGGEALVFARGVKT